jgi:predicted enzyme related to lactoylglutathione lyase
MKAESAATVFQVSDLAASKRYYIEVLGFEIDFEFGDYASVRIDDVHIHLNQNPDSTAIGHGGVYIFCDEVSAYYQDVAGRGASTSGEPVQAPYGMLDFQAVDPDGNTVSFGCDTEG